MSSYGLAVRRCDAPVNPHWHAIVLEGGFDENGNFIHIPFGNLHEMIEVFRRSVVKFFLDSELISQDMADNLLRWRHSGFSVDASILLPGGSSKKRESLAQYLARPPISLNKVSYENFHGRVLFHTSFNEYFKENLKLFEAPEFIALLTQHLPKKEFTISALRALLVPQPRYLDRKALRSGTRAGWLETEIS